MEVVGVSAPGPWVDQLTEWGIRHEALRHATRAPILRKDALALGQLVGLLRRLQPDIVHTHNPKPGLYGRLAARLVGVPAVVNTVHGLYATPEDSRARRLLVYSLERVASTCSQAELVQNVEDLDVLRRLRVPEEKLVLLGNGVDLERFRPRSDREEGAKVRASLGIAPDRVVVGTVGRLVREKGLQELFDAARRLSSTRPDIAFVVVGGEDPDKADAITAAERRGAERLGNVVFTGYREDVEAVYGAFDIAAFPSHREGFPRSAMEAAASGLPVIDTDIRGCRQVVEGGATGRLVPARDAGALAVAIEALADDPGARVAMGQAARRKAEAEFDDHEVVRRTMDTYRHVLNGAPHRRHRSIASM
jgi:glycosyltransferase involved in cell wall biosynthesis